MKKSKPNKNRKGDLLLSSITIPSWKLSQYREVWLIQELSKKGEIKKVKSLGFVHMDSDWKNNPDIELSFCQYFLIETERFCHVGTT
jgi:hypothetical protein